MAANIINNSENEENIEEYKPDLAVIDDIPQIKSLGASFWGREGVYSDEFYIEALKQSLSYVYKDQIKNKNILIGICLVRYDENSDLVGIDLLCVNKDYQGMGFGKALLGVCLNKCIENGFHKFYLHVATTNTKAINLYKKFGFYKYKFVKNYYFNDKPPDNDAFMMKLYRYRKYDEINPKKANSLKKEEKKENEKIKVKEDRNEKEEIKHIVEKRGNNYNEYKNNNNNYIEKYNNNMFNVNNNYYNNHDNIYHNHQNDYNHYNISDYRSGYQRRLNHVFRY